MANEIARALRRRMTPYEVRVWAQLRALRAQGVHFRRQVPIGTYVVDFACLKAELVVEIDGSQHGMPGAQARDLDRDQTLARLGFKVLRFWNTDLNRSVIDVIETIFHEATGRLADRKCRPRR